MTQQDKHRAAFEAVARISFYDLTHCPERPGRYLNQYTQLAWHFWQAAIELGRQQRGEPVAWVVPDYGFLFPTKEAAKRYLSNIGDYRHPQPLYAAPQPANPVVKDDEYAKA